VHNYLGLEWFRVVAEAPLPRGHATLAMTFAPSGPARVLEGKGVPADVTLYYDGVIVAKLDLPHSVPATFGTTGLSCGRAYFDSVDPTQFQEPFPFTGTIHKVVLDLTGELTINPEAEFVRLMAQQ
jgi:hypothetical protein